MKTLICTVAGAAAMWAAGADDVRLRTRLAGGSIDGLTPSGQVEFKARPSRGPELSFNVEVEDVNLPPGTVLEVQINGRAAGKLTISLPPVRGGELELNSRDGDQTPTLKAGDVVTVRSASGVVLSGAIQTRALDDILRNPPPQFTLPGNNNPAAPSASSGGDASRFRTNLAGGAIGGVVPSGHIDFRQKGSDFQLTVEVEDLNVPLGTKVDIEIDGRVIGQITVSGVGRGGELELSTRDGALVQQIKSGAVVLVRAPGRGAVLTGVAQPVSEAAVIASAGSPSSSASSSSSSSSQAAARLRSGLAGGAINGVRPSGHIDFRTQPGSSDARLNVEVEDVNLPVGTVLEVEVDGRVIGQIKVGALRGGELELNTREGAVVDRIKAGATVVVRAPGRGAILSGVAQARPIDTPPSSQSSQASGGSSSTSAGGSSSGGGNSGSSGNSGSGNSGSGNSGSGSGNSGSGGSGSGSGGSGNSGSGSSGGSGSGSGSSGSGSGSGSGGSGSGSGSGGSDKPSDDKPGDDKGGNKPK